MLDFFVFCIQSTLYTFPISGVTTYLWIPPCVAFVVSFFTSMGGISGSFLLLPFQMSILNFTNPSVNATNFVYNLVAIPSGVYRYIKEGRMVWPVTWIVILGTTPGVLLGYYIRVKYLPDPTAFKFFVGCVLLYIGLRLLYEFLPNVQKRYKNLLQLDEKFQQSNAGTFSKEAIVSVHQISWKNIQYSFWGESFQFSPVALFVMAIIVGIIGGTYGIGGGALIAPICVSILHLPIHSIAGAALMGTFMTSIVGVIFYTFISQNGQTWGADYMLGILFGIGGLGGMYCGARMQKFVSRKKLNICTGILVVILGMLYSIQLFL